MRDIWLWANERQIWLTAEHLPGVMNKMADTASRKAYAHDSEWKLNDQIFQILDKKYGPFDVDLFATRLNAQCPNYFSWQPDPNAIATDALLQ